MTPRTALVLAHDDVPGRGSRELGTAGPALADLGLDVVVTTVRPRGPAVPRPESVAERACRDLVSRFATRAGVRVP